VKKVREWLTPRTFRFRLFRNWAPSWSMISPRRRLRRFPPTKVLGSSGPRGQNNLVAACRRRSHMCTNSPYETFFGERRPPRIASGPDRGLLLFFSALSSPKHPPPPPLTDSPPPVSSTRSQRRSPPIFFPPSFPTF